MALAALGLSLAGAKTRTADIFGDHGVLQRNTAFPVFGKGKPGDVVTVTVASQTQTATVGADSSWSASFNPLPAGGPINFRVTAPDTTIILSDVLVGEVWMGAGQSNMEISVDTDSSLYPYIVNDTLLRMISHSRQVFPWTRSYSAKGTGDRRHPAMYFSLEGYLFGQRLRARYGVPVGIAIAAAGGTATVQWLPDTSVTRDSVIRAWETPEMINDYGVWGKWYGGCFRDLVYPYIPFAFAGILWDQGESGTRLSYTSLDQAFYTMLRTWRLIWGRDIPFILAQFPKGYGWTSTSPDSPLQPLPADPNADIDRDQPMTYEAFARTLSLPKTGLAINIDLKGSSHPPDKALYADRYLLTARQLVYGEDVLPYGPRLLSAQASGKAVDCVFGFAGKGLVAKGADKVQGFALAGADRKYVWATATITAPDRLRLESSVAAPKYILYQAWRTVQADSCPGNVCLKGDRLGNEWCNLYNADGLPAFSVVDSLPGTVGLGPAGHVGSHPASGAGFDLRGRRLPGPGTRVPGTALFRRMLEILSPH